MNKLRCIIGIVAITILFACSEEEWLKNNNQGEIVVEAGFANTRISYNDDGKTVHVTWNTGDQIGIYSKSQNNLGYTAQISGVFSNFYAEGEELKATGGEEVFAYYPYDRWLSEDKIKEIRLESTHMINPLHTSLADLDFIYAKGQVKDNELFLNFKHAFAFLKITVDIDLLFNNVNRGLYIEGSDYISTLDYYAEYSYFDMESATIKGEKSNNLYYFIPDEVIPKGAMEVTCYIPVLPQSENATLKIYASNYDEIEFLWGKEVPEGGLKAGELYAINIHEKTEYYTSIDYSMDGEYELLQRATVGKGIDLVFMGDAFVDRDMGNNGWYEQCMRKAMDDLFLVEPYKTLRDRFNVYMVKVVSPNAEFGEDAVHALNESDGACFEYASRIKDINKERLMLTVIYNYNSDFFGLDRSYCAMYSDDSFVAYIMEAVDNAAGTIIHETGGHGIAHLGDEYFEYLNETFPEYLKSRYDNYESIGWYANVDYDNNPATIKWAHLLNDPLYKDEVGIYEGAFWEYGIYRSSRASTMGGEVYSIGGNVWGEWFNAPSREAIYKKVMSLSEGAEWQYDYKRFVEWDAPFRNTIPPYEFSTRSNSINQKQRHQRHQPPVVVKKTWHDALETEWITQQYQ